MSKTHGVSWKVPLPLLTATLVGWADSSSIISLISMWFTIYFRKWKLLVKSSRPHTLITAFCCRQIPFHHAEEATRAIIPLLGSRYYQDKASSFVGGLWQAFTECQWVEPGQGDSTGNGELWFQKGPSPAPEYKMRHWKDIASTECKAWMWRLEVREGWKYVKVVKVGRLWSEVSDGTFKGRCEGLP